MSGERPPTAAQEIAPTAPGESEPHATPDKPLSDWRELLVTSPDDVGLLFRLGSTLARTPANAFEAIGLLQRLLAIEPHHPLANGALALAYAQIGQRTAAHRHLSRARRLGQPVDTRLEALLAAG